MLPLEEAAPVTRSQRFVCDADLSPGSRTAVRRITLISDRLEAGIVVVLCDISGQRSPIHFLRKIGDSVYQWAQRARVLGEDSSERSVIPQYSSILRDTVVVCVYVQKTWIFE